MNMRLPSPARYDAHTLRADLVTGLTLAVVVIPQAIAFSTTLAGLPPHFGLYAAIWGVLLTALLNPSPIFHGGPNSAMSAAIGITLLPVAPQFGSDYMGYALTLILLAGLVQLLFVMVRPLGRMLDLLSEPVINGLICGIGVFLIMRSLTTFGGLPINTEVEWPLWVAWQSLLAIVEFGNLYALQIGCITLASILVLRQFECTRTWSILLGILLGTLYSEWLSARVGLENTLVEQIAGLSHLGLFLPSLPLFSQEALPDIIRILPGAVTLALLGLVQTSAAMRRVNRQRGVYVSTRRGTFADAISNLFLPLLSSLPTCASFNRMAVMQSMGAVSRLAAVSSAVFLLLLVAGLSDLIARIPMPAMAATIMVVGANMLDWQTLREHLRHPPEAVVFVASFSSVLVFGLFGAVVTGALLALGWAKWAKAHPRIQLQGERLVIRGTLYYASLPLVEAAYHQALVRCPNLIIDFSRADYIDPEGLRWLANLRQRAGVELKDRRLGGERRQSGRGDRTDRRRRALI